MPKGTEKPADHSVAGSPRQVASVMPASSLPPGWAWTTLGEITSPSEARADPSDLPADMSYVGLEHIEKDTGRLLGYGHAQDVRSTKTLFRAGDVLYGKLRPYLNKVCIPDFDGVCSTDILVFPKRDFLCNRFLKYRLLASDFVRFASLNVSGVQHPRVHFKTLAQFRVALPPLPEQRRIVARIEELFSQLDAAEEGLRRVQRNLKRYRAAVLKAAVKGRLVPTEAELARAEGRPYETGVALLQRILAERRRKWEEREWAKLVEKAKKKAAQARRKARGLPARIKDIPPEEWQAIPESEYRRYLPKDDRWKQKYKEPTPPDTSTLSPLPEGWVWATVEMLTWHVTSGSRGWAKYYAPEGALFVRVGNFQRGTIELDLENVAFVQPPSSSETMRTALQENDVLITITADVGMVGVVDRRVLAWGQAYINQHVCLTRPVIPQLSPFIGYAIASQPGQKQVEEKQYGATKKGLGLEDVKEIIVPLPPLAEQRRIVAEVERRLSVVREAEKAVETNLKRIARLRQAILKRAFEGKLVPQDPSDEPAEVLLERIRKQSRAKRPAVEPASAPRKAGLMSLFEEEGGQS